MRVMRDGEREKEKTETERERENVLKRSQVLADYVADYCEQKGLSE